MASSSSNPHITLEVEDEYSYPYPYPSHVYTPSFVTLKLSGRDEYGIWKTQILCLLESHDMLGFIDGTFVNPETSSSVSGKEKVGDHQTRHRLWRRSDALVKGWILGSLSKEILTYVVDRLTERLHHQERNNEADFSAKDVWDELHTMYVPVVLQPELVVEDTSRNQIRAEAQQALYTATLEGYWVDVDEVLEGKEVKVIDEITTNGNTALHVAVSNMKKSKFLEKLLEKIPRRTQLSDVRNSDGSTPLHVAAIIGNLEAAKILVGKDPNLLLAKDNEGQTPLTLALSNTHAGMFWYLLQHIKTDAQKDTLFSGASGDELLVTVISSKDFRLASDLLQRYRALHSDAVLMAISQNFPSKCNILYDLGSGRFMYKIDDRLEGCAKFITSLPPDHFWVLMIFITLLSAGFCLIFVLLMLTLQKLVRRFYKKFQIFNDAIKLLEKACVHLKNENSGSYIRYYTNPILEATRQNADEVVRTIVYHFPNAISSASEEGHTIIQYAVINRSEKVYNLLYNIGEHRNIYRTIKDSSRNNLLHLAARLAPANKLNLISGAALQIQRELQWFKEVENFVCPLTIIQKNSFDETPQMVFTKEHKGLVMEGEKWMKATAESYTITAALIITIVFAAAITVPGGNNQETGIPVFTNKTAFRIFAISDAISLFTAVTSLLMFLSILTARFAEQDFLFKLPTKLMIGLTTLFISTTAMIVAFGATLYLVFGQSNSRILIPIAVLTCLPITSFVTLQFPLVIELMSATYGHSIFGRKSDESFY